MSGVRRVNTRIEEMARALCKADGVDPDHVPNEDYADGFYLAWMDYRKDAEQALKVIDALHGTPQMPEPFTWERFEQTLEEFPWK